MRRRVLFWMIYNATNIHKQFPSLVWVSTDDPSTDLLLHIKQRVEWICMISAKEIFICNV
jgi:hypothetical protein